MTDYHIFTKLVYAKYVADTAVMFVQKCIMYDDPLVMTLSMLRRVRNCRRYYYYFNLLR